MKVFKFIFGALFVILLSDALIAPGRPGWPTFATGIHTVTKGVDSADAYVAAWLRGLIYN